MPLKEQFGKQVKLLRQYRNMTQECLSELVDIDIRQLARIESGDSFVTAETLEKLCKALNISYKDLFTFEDSVNNCENMTSDSILKFKHNYSRLNKIIQKLAVSDDKTSYLILAAEALEKKSALEKLKSILFGMTLK